MPACPRCGGDAEYLVDETFNLVRCDFCDDVIDATETWHLDDADQLTVAAKVLD